MIYNYINTGVRVVLMYFGSAPCAKRKNERGRNTLAFHNIQQVLNSLCIIPVCLRGANVLMKQL